MRRLVKAKIDGQVRCVVGIAIVDRLLQIQQCNRRATHRSIADVARLIDAVIIVVEIAIAID